MGSNVSRQQAAPDGHLWKLLMELVVVPYDLCFHVGSNSILNDIRVF